MVMDVASRLLAFAAGIACGTVWALAGLCVSGCATAPVQEPETHARSSQGIVSFEQVKDPAARPPQPDPGQEYRRAVLQEGFTLPAYPEEALAAGAPPTDVVVRLVVDTDGSVDSVRRSPLAGPPTSEWDELFYRVVSETVTGWKYEPCELRELEEGPDRDGDGASDYTMVVTSTPITVYLDLKFRFDIVAGAGRVSMGPDHD